VNYVCIECHYVGERKSKKPGSKGVEIFMWSMFPLGLPYTIWRMTSKKYVCRECEGEMLVKEDSSFGALLIRNSMSAPSQKPKPANTAPAPTSIITPPKPPIQTPTKVNPEEW